MKILIPHILALASLFILSSNFYAQNVLDACFTSTGTGTNFNGSANITNVGGDMAVYGASGWDGVNFDVAKPFPCENPRAIKLNSNSELKEVVGFKLSEGLATGTFFSVTFKVIKTQGTFSLGVYSRSFGQFYDDGEIGAEVINTENANFNNWSEVTVSFNVPNSSAGHNWLFLRAENGAGIISNFCQTDLALPTVDLGEDIDICDGEQTVLDATNVGSWYQWSTGSNEPTITVSNENTYSATANNACGSDTDEVLVTVHTEPEFNVTADTTICEGTTLTLEAPGWEAEYVWHDGTTNPTFTVDSAGTYNVTVEDNCFTTFDEIVVSYLGPPEVDLGPDSTVCGGTVNYYVASGGPTSEYLWSNGVESPGIGITTTGNYSVQITNECGTASDDVYVEFSYGPGDFLPDSIVFCEGKPMVIDISETEGYYEWSDGSTDGVYNVSNPGWHYVKIVDDDSCFVAYDTLKVLRVYCDCPVFAANSFTPNGDGINEEYKVTFDCEPYDFQLSIYDRWGHIVFLSNNADEAWDGRNRNGRKLPSSLFHYVLEYTFEYQGFPIYKRGTVTLMGD